MIPSDHHSESESPGEQQPRPSRQVDDEIDTAAAQSDRPPCMQRRDDGIADAESDPGGQRACASCGCRSETNTVPAEPTLDQWDDLPRSERLRQWLVTLAPFITSAVSAGAQLIPWLFGR